MTVDAQRAKSIFLAALEKAHEARGGLLDEVCGGDADLRRRVERLLQAHDQPDSVPEASAAPEGTQDPLPQGNRAIDRTGTAVTETTGTVIGPYKLIQEIGEGGMGTVWMAQQTEPVKRLVAVKLIKAGMDSRQVIARFEAERQALALMEHANIARVLDAGATRAGRPYFVMDLVKGVPITRYCDEHYLTPRQRLELFIPVCQAIQHAHQKGIIHRDLKPSNVLVAHYDGKPVPKVIDFGVAKAAGQSLTDKTLVTGFGNIVGTLEYMSPEQAEINQLDIDTRSDIYSLGVLLYELLAGSPPFSRRELDKGMLEMLRVIREKEPTKPSTKLSTAEGLPTLAANRGTEPAKLTRLVRGELDWIVMKALEKDRNRRYEAASAFAADVKRYLHDEPVQACPPSAWYRLRKFTRRNRAALTAVALVLLALVLGTVISTWQAIRATAAEKLAGERLISERNTRNALDAAREEQDQQRTRTNRDLSQALAEVAGLREKARAARRGDAEPWNQFRAALRRAEALAGSELADPVLLGRVRALQAELKQGEADRRMVALLEEIRLDRGNNTINCDDYGHRVRLLEEMRLDRGNNTEFTVSGGLRPAYEAAFKEYGLPVFDLDVEEAARRIAASAIRDSLVAALDHCALNHVHLMQRLIPVIQRVVKDDGPWVRAYYDARLRPDGPALLRLAKQPEALQQSPTTICMLAFVAYQIDQASAIELLREGQRRHPADFWINYQLGMDLWMRNGPPNTRDVEEAISFTRVALAARPENPVLLMSLARMHLDAGHYDEAVAVCQQFILVHSNDPDAYDFLRWAQIVALRIKPEGTAAAAHNNLGWVLYEHGKLDGAIAEYRKAIELDPKNAWAHNVIGAALYHQGKLDEAIAEYRKAIELDPKLALAHNNLGSALSDQGKLDEAIAADRKAVELDPSNAYTYFNLGDNHARLGRWKEAAAVFDRALERAPTDHSPTDHYRWCLAATLQAAAGDLAGYRRSCRGMLGRFGDAKDPVIAERTAIACSLLPGALSTADLDRVQRLAKLAVTGTENNRDGSYDLFVMATGLVEYRAGRDEAAVEWMGRAHPGLATIKFAVLAMAHHRLGHAKEAAAALTQAKATLEKMPDPAKGRRFGAGEWFNWVQAQLLCREAEELLKKDE
jgi:serine/threonine protein kinase/cytochrome c-type biogenesis protein CcmH/NrfG